MKHWHTDLKKIYLTEVINQSFVQSKTKPKVLLITLKGMWDIKESDLLPLRQIAEVDYVQVDKMTEEQLAARCSNYDYLMLNMDFLPFPDPNNMSKLTKKFYDNPGVQNLKGINVDMTDADFFSPSIARQKRVIIQVTPNAVTRSVAESAVCEILLHAKGRHISYTQDKNCTKGINLQGKTAGIIGKGNIGSAVGKILEGMGMNVLYNDIQSKGQNTPIEKIFQDAQVISIHIPAIQIRTNKSNEGFIGSKLLNLCKGTILINLATDIIVDNEALRNAIRTKKIIGYSVERGRKLNENLEKIPQVHISPCSFDSDESRRNILRIWIQNMITAVQGNPQNQWN